MGLLIAGSYWADTVVLVLTLLYLIYWYTTCTFDYWIKKGVTEVKTKEPFFGSVRKAMLLQKQFSLHFHDIYKELDGAKFGGYFDLRKPSLMVRDPELIKQIVVKDFSNFTDNISIASEKNDPMFANNIFAMKGDKWKYARSKMVPAFATGKIRAMFPLILEVCEELKQNLQRRIDAKDCEFDAHRLCAEYTTDVVASCAFGIKSDSLRQPENQFRKMGRALFEPDSFFRQLEIMTVFTLPYIAEILGCKFISKEVEVFFKDLITKAFAYREKHTEFKRNDFINLLMQLKKLGSVDVEESDKKEMSNNKEVSDTGKIEFNDTVLTAQAIGFFLDGFETSSKALSFAVLELAMNPDVQEKLREELKASFDEDDGKIDYDIIKNCVLLDNILHETLRIYPIAGVLSRECTKNYTIPDTNVQIEVGTVITVPVYGLHHNAEYYPDPEVFDPDRFTEEAKKTRPQFTYLPFGEGPRQCIGFRFAQAQLKAAIATLVLNFEIKKCAKTQYPVIFDDQMFLLHSKGGLFVEISPL